MAKVKNALKTEEELKDKKSRKKTSKKKRSSKMAFSFKPSERVKRIAGLSFLVISVYLLLAIVSYFISWFSYNNDDIFSNIEFSRVLLDTDIDVKNWTGRLGAALSHVIVKQWFGLSSLLIVFNIFVFGIYYLLEVKLFNLLKTITYSIFSIVWISLFLGFIIVGDKSSIFGGVFGYYSSQWLIGFIGKTGTILVLVFSLLTFIIISFNLKINQILEYFKSLSDKEDDEDQLSEDTTVEGLSLDELAEMDGLKGENEDDSEDDGSIEIEMDNKTTDDDEGINDDDEDDDDFEIEVTKSEETIDTGEQTADKENDGEDEEMVHHGVDTEYDPKEDLKDFKTPDLNLLDHHGSSNEIKIDKAELEENKNRIVKTLGDYNIKIEKIKATVGPTITLYEIVPAPGIRISKIRNLGDDIALSLAALGIRIIAPIPGKGTIGIEVPNKNPEIVSMKTILSSEKYQNTKHDLPVGIGKTISNETFVFDLAKMPHMLIAGATGQGKSVGINAVITSLLYKKHPAQLKFVMVDPKKVELSLFSKIERHYLAKLPGENEAIITDVKDVVTTLNSLCIEMDERYDLLKDAQVRNIKEYNAKFIARKLNPENGHRYLPYIVLIVDEFADLIMTAGKEVEGPIARLAQLARAIGIHLIIATQRPSVKIITGVIKANFPARIAFRVTSVVDSRTILDSKGAEQLVGKGDMLLSTGKDVVRLQCAFVDTPEVEDITSYIGEQRGYSSAMELPEYVDEETETPDIDPDDRDDLFEDAARLLVENQHGSTSLIQRKLKLGYNRAGRIIDQLEAAGIVGPFKGSKAREVLFQDLQSLEQYLKDL